MMRATVLLIIAALAWIAWVASALAVKEHQARQPIAPVTRAALQLCAPIVPAPPPRPVVRHRGIVLYPNHSESV